MDAEETPTTLKAAALLDGDEASTEKRWTELSDQALDEEIAAYRTGIEDVSKELEALGVIVCLEEQNGADGPDTAGIEVRLFDSLACEKLHAMRPQKGSDLQYAEV